MILKPKSEEECLRDLEKDFKRRPKYYVKIFLYSINPELSFYFKNI